MCRECTGHLVLLESESSARRKRKAKTTKTENTNKNPKNRNKQPGPRHDSSGSRRSETNRKGETRGVELEAKRPSQRKSVLVSKFKGQAADLRSAGVRMAQMF